MPTVFTEDGCRFKIYPNDHPPAHVHVRKAENVARVSLETVEVLSSEGFNSRELSRIIEIVEDHQAELLEMWDTFHESR
ncbi:MAG: DUF4160 domain-containing protein [Anaerolineae bacterium]|nr:DUF4160 domain-containing protein [Anaerolineae bacterium]